MRAHRCIYPEGEGMATKTGRPCKAFWTLRPTESARLLRSQAWPASFKPPPKKMSELDAESGQQAVETIKRPWL
jgi:hypothetical protein